LTLTDRPEIQTGSPETPENKESADGKKRPKKRKAGRIIRNILLVLLVLALGAASAQVWYMLSPDKRFPRAAERGLKEAWETSEPELSLRDLDLKADTSFVDAEYKAVASFKDKKFRDEELGKLVTDYISALEDCSKAVKAKDPEKQFKGFWKEFSEPYGRRLRAICALYNNGYIFPEGVPEEYTSRLNDILFQGWALNKTEEISFERGKSDNELVAKVKNDSGFALEYIELTIDLYNSKGKLIETVTAYESNIKKGKTFTLRCYESEGGKASEFVIKAINCEKAD